MTKDQVSRLCQRLDEQVAAFRERPLEGAYPYLWLDAKQEKVRDGAHVVSKAVVIAYGVHETGRREVIGLDVGEIESEAFWREFLRSLKRRGFDGVRLCVCDSHEGLKNAIARVLGCPWQRCTVHFVRDMHQHCRPSQRALVSAALREVFNADGYDQARERVTAVIEQPADLAPDERVELVGADGAACADFPADVPPAVLPDAAVVGDPLVAGARAGAIAGVAALAARRARLAAASAPWCCAARSARSRPAAPARARRSLP